MGRNPNSVCDECGKEFYKRPSDKNKTDHDFCSETCYGKWYKRNKSGKDNPQYTTKLVNCTRCSKEIKRVPGNLKRNENHFCSKDCQYKYRSEIAENSDTPFGRNWKSQREKAIKNDNNQCQKCGLTRKRHKKQFGSDLEVDHIVKRKNFVRDDGSFAEEKANKIKNLNTLCIPCHRGVESVRKNIKELKYA